MNKGQILNNQLRKHNVYMNDKQWEVAISAMTVHSKESMSTLKKKLTDHFDPADQKDAKIINLIKNI